MPIPPALVEADTVTQRIALVGLSLNFAAALYGGNRFTSALEYRVSPNKFFLAVYKSTDLGVTWAPLDTTNAPAAGHGAGFFNVGGTSIYFTYVPNNGGDGQTRVVAFDLITETWGTPSVPLPLRTSSDFWSAHDLSVLSDGTYVVTAYTSAAPFPPGHPQPVLATYQSGPGWSSVIVIDNLITGAISRPRQALTPSDLVCIIWGGQYAGPVNKTQAVVFAAGVLGSANVVDATHFNSYTRGIYIGATDEYWFPGGRDVSGNNIVLTKGGPSANPTVWTTENPGGLNPSLYYPFLPLITKIDDNDIFLVWNATIDDPSGERQIQYIEQVNLGGWGSMQVMWDTITQPLTPPSTLPGDEELQSVGVTDGDLDFLTALFQTFPIIGSFCGTLYYGDVSLAPPANPEITLDAAFGASFVFNPNGSPTNVSSLSHTVCSQSVSGGGGGVTTDTPYIVRTYQFNIEPYPADTVYFTHWSDLGYRFQKTARNLLLDIDTGGIDAAVTLQGDGVTKQTFTVNATSDDRNRVIACDSDLEAKLWRLGLTPGGTAGAKAQLFTAKLDYIADSNIVTYYDSYETDFGYVGWKFMKQGWIDYKGGPITIVFIVDDGLTFYSVTLPVQATREMVRFYFPAENAGVLNKSKTYRIQITGSDGFRLYADSAIEWFGFGADQRGSFRLVQITAEMQQPIAQGAVGAWEL